MRGVEAFVGNRTHGTESIQNGGYGDNGTEGIDESTPADLLVLAQIGVHAGQRRDDLLLLRAVLHLHVRLLPHAAHLREPLLLRLVVAGNQHFRDATRDVPILLQDEVLQVNDVSLQVRG